MGTRQRTSWVRHGLGRVVGLLLMSGLVPGCLGDDVGATSPWAGSTPESTGPVLVVLCHGSNQDMPAAFDLDYYVDQFTETDGSRTLADYWRDVSHGKFSIEGSVVVDVQMDVPRDDIGDRDDQDGVQCRDAAEQQHGADADDFAGVAVLKPQTLGRTVEAISADASQVRVRTVGHSVPGDWSSPPFTAVLTSDGALYQKRDEDGDPTNRIEAVLVTDVDLDGDVATFTIERAQRGYKDRETSASDWPAETEIRDVVDIHGGDGVAVAAAYSSPTSIAHEMGHMFGWGHSRRLSTADKGYNDCFDIMSALGCVYRFDLDVPTTAGSIELDHGPGMVTANLDRKGWIGTEDVATDSCLTTTYDLRAVGLEGEGLYQVRVPIQQVVLAADDDEGIAEVGARYLTIELRSRAFAWDRAIPRDAVVLHLVGDNGIPYLFDAAPGGVEGMIAGDSYTLVDDESPLGNRTITVEEIDDGAGTARVTVEVPDDVPVDACRVAGSTTQDEPSDEPTGEATEDPSEDPSPSEDPEELVGAACVPGVWELDSQAFVSAIGAAAGATGAEQLAYVGGSYTMTISEGGTWQSVRVGWSLQIAEPEGTFTMVFDADESGTVSWDDAGSMDYAEVDGTSVTDITVVLESGGVRQELPLDLLPPGVLGSFPEPELMAGTATYTCSGDALVIVADDSGVPSSWTRVG